MNILSFFKRKYHPLNTVEVSAQALRANYQYLSKLSPDVQIAPVLKSNAYGHDLQIVGKILDDVGAPFFCVDSLYEAYELLKINIQTPILIMGYVNPENLQTKKLPFSYAVYDEEQLTAISQYQQIVSIHIFVDTGMHREGIQLSDLPEFLSFLKEFPQIHVDGLMSHFSAGENKIVTKKQLKNFEIAKDLVKVAGFRPQWFHIAASSGLLHHVDYNDNIGNMARCGIALYGIDLEGKNKYLQPALTLTTTLNQIKELKKGETVGYDQTFTAKKNMMIGILAMGYFDGIDRRLSNTGSVLIDNIVCPIVGRVSMNLTTIDISDVKDAQVGNKVIVYSHRLVDNNSVLHAANSAKTIPYDLIVHIPESTKRIVV